MNFTASPHAFTALGVGTTGTLGLHTPTLPLSLPQRNPFAIQELLGLGNQSPERCRPSPQTHSDSFLSASAFLSSTLTPTLPTSSVTSGLSSSTLPYMAWRSSFINALSGSAQGLLNFGTSQTSPHSLLSKSEFKEGIVIY